MEYDFLTNIIPLYNEISVPAFVCDEQLNLIWLNLAATSFFKEGNTARLSLLFPDVNFCDARQAVQAGKTFETSFSFSAGNRVTLHFLPLANSDGKFALVSFQQSTSETTGSNTLPVVSIQSQAYRTAMFGIFNVISVLANSFDQNSMYDELAYLNSLSYSCYSIIRTNINIGEHYNCLHNKDAVKKERIHLNHFCRILAENVSHLLCGSNISFRFEITEEPVYTLADREKLTVALLNVLYNSCVFSDLENEVVFSLKKQGNSFVITVSDKGIGIPTDVLPYVFDPFYSNTKKSDYNGNGLGLTVAKEIAEVHGGTCFISSEPYKGTIFSIKCPIQDDPSMETVVSSPVSPYFMKRLSAENIFLAEVAKAAAY